MIGASAGADAETANADDRGHDPDAPAHGFEPRALFDMRFEEAKLARGIQSQKRRSIRDRCERVRQRHPITRSALFDFRLGHIVAERSAAEERQERPLLVFKRDHVDAGREMLPASMALRAISRP